MTAIDHESPFDPEPAPAPPKTEVSMLALVAFILAILGCTSPIGVILGMVALIRLVGEPTVRGRGLAAAAVVLGLCFSIGLGSGLYVVMSRMADLTAFVMNAPNDALEAGFAGDLDGFRSVFVTSHPPEVAQSFIDGLRERYGEFVSIGMLQTPAPTGQSERDGRPILPTLYRAQFDSGTIDIEVELMPGDPGKSIPHWIESMRVIDRRHLPLRYPPLPDPPTGGTIRLPVGADTDAEEGDAGGGASP